MLSLYECFNWAIGAVQVLHKTGSDIALALQRELRLEESAGLHSDCLVDTWVGIERFYLLRFIENTFLLSGKSLQY
jgi:hypothetical protein